MTGRIRAVREGALTRLLAVVLLWHAAPGAAAPAGQWSREIADASARFGIPAPWIGRVIAAESGGHASRFGRPIVSRAGAMGLMQLMPGTWRDMRLAHGLGADPHDPHDNILAGTAYLRLLYDQFGYPGLFAAYNAGPARYAGHLRGGRSLPDETRAYVAAIAPVRPSRSAAAPASPAELFALRAAASSPPHAPSPHSAPAPLFVALSQSPAR